MVRDVEYTYRKYFSDYVTYAMEEKGIRPWYVAYYSEMQDSNFRKCLKAARLPNPINLIMMAELFECSVNDLLGFESIGMRSHDHIFDSGLDSRCVGEYISSQIERLMRHRDVSTAELATLCDCAETTILSYLSNNVVPDTAVLLRICSALNCTPSELLGY